MRRPLLAAAVLLLLPACWKADPRVAWIDALQKKLATDQPALQHEAETRDPTRPGLHATFEQSSIMSMRSTTNPERPEVAYVRIKWMFHNADGSPLGEAVFDYIYALTKDQQWVKADEADTATMSTTTAQPR